MALDQLVLRSKSGRAAQVHLHPLMRREQLAARLERLNLGELEEVRLHSDESTWPAYIELLRQIWPALTVTELPSTEAGVHRMMGRITFTVTDHYFRAIAKIAFHYFLLHSKRGFCGREDAFKAIREFIMVGGDERRFFIPPSSRPFAAPSGARRPTQPWSHVLMVNEANAPFMAYVHFFDGPGWLRPPYYLKLGAPSATVIAPTYVWGHRFIYDATPSGRYVGQVEEVNLLKLPARFWVPNAPPVAPLRGPGQP